MNRVYELIDAAFAAYLKEYGGEEDGYDEDDFIDFVVVYLHQSKGPQTPTTMAEFYERHAKKYRDGYPGKRRKR